MKIKSAIIATFISSAVSYGQGTLGTLRIENMNGAGIIPIYLADGTTQVKGADYVATLIWNGGQVGEAYPFGAEGRFTSGTGILMPGTTEGGTATGLTLRVWDTRDGGVSFDAARINGTSQPFDNPVGGGATLPPTLINLQSFNLSLNTALPATLIPEPSTIALGIVGMAALQFRFRK
jgi:hypothetical protein